VTVVLLLFTIFFFLSFLLSNEYDLALKRFYHKSKLKPFWKFFLPSLIR